MPMVIASMATSGWFFIGDMNFVPACVLCRSQALAFAIAA
jgi:hypothetical protein